MCEREIPRGREREGAEGAREEEREKGRVRVSERGERGMERDSQREREGERGVSTGAGQYGNYRPGFGVHSITQKLSAYNIIRVLNIIKLKYIILYNYNIVL